VLEVVGVEEMWKLPPGHALQEQGELEGEVQEPTTVMMLQMERQILEVEVVGLRVQLHLLVTGETVAQASSFSVSRRVQ
jgi:hypothetical protein